MDGIEYYIMGRKYESQPDFSLTWADDNDRCPYVLISVGFKTHEDAKALVDDFFAHPEEHTAKRFREKGEGHNEWSSYGDENGNAEPLIKLHNGDFKIEWDYSSKCWWNDDFLVN